MKQIVEVQFTGNAKTYIYSAPAFCSDLPGAIQPGDRVVVINKIKEDGSVSLSIATVVGVGEASETSLSENSTMPFVQLVPKSTIDMAAAAHSTPTA
jgi:hypothetical protein